MSIHWQYAKYVLRHKRYVYKAGRALGLGRWQLLTHDLSKFLPSEWLPYARFFYAKDAPPRRDSTGYYKAAETGDRAFDYAWLLHQKRNRHHWQWWTLPLDDGGTKTLPMPDKYRREMLADWRGAGMAQGTPDTLAWYRVNKDKMQLHPDTRAWVERELGVA